MNTIIGAGHYGRRRRDLAEHPRTWLITGVAGFIGSNLLEELLSLGQNVVGLDDFSSGHQANIDDAVECAGAPRGHFRLIRGDIRDVATCRKACVGVDYVLHQAAVVSVPRSIDDPVGCHSVNVGGFLNMLLAAREAEVKRFVYASSCAVYGNASALPLAEDRERDPLSPYAATKVANEVYASVFQRAYGLRIVGLRYFNVFGQRQDPDGAYAAVIPRWITRLLGGTRCEIHGNGQTSRDFCHVANVAQANLLAATSEPAGADAEVYNVACGRETTLNEVFRMIRLGLAGYEPSIAAAQPVYGTARRGDIHRSVADISKIRGALQYEPTHTTAVGLGQALKWYTERSLQHDRFADARAVAAS